MKVLRRVRQDHIGALLLLLIGGGVLGLGLTYDVGSLNRMGPGYVPVVLGILMILVALAIGATAAPPEPKRPPREGAEPASDAPQWRGWGCIVASVAAFVALGDYGGLVPATFVTVLVAAMGDRESTWKGSLALAAILTAFGVAIFHYALNLQLPMFQWGV